MQWDGKSKPFPINSGLNSKPRLQVNPSDLQTKAFSVKFKPKASWKTAACKDSERLPVYVSQLLASSLKDFFDIDHLLFPCLHVRGFVWHPWSNCHSNQSIQKSKKLWVKNKVMKELNFHNVHCFERLSWPPIDKSHVTYVMMLWQRVEDWNGGKTEGRLALFSLH